MTTEKALLRLTDRQRQLIELRDHQKLTWAKVGEALGITHGYALKLHKGAVKMLAHWESTDEKMLFDAKKLAGKWTVSVERQEVRGRVSEIVSGQELVDRLVPPPEAIPAPPKPRTVISRGEPAAVQPKVVVIRGIPVPQTTTVQKHWSSVTIRA